MSKVAVCETLTFPNYFLYKKILFVHFTFLVQCHAKLFKYFECNNLRFRTCQTSTMQLLQN